MFLDILSTGFNKKSVAFKDHLYMAFFKHMQICPAEKALCYCLARAFVSFLIDPFHLLVA